MGVRKIVNGLSLKSLTFPIFIPPPERTGSALLRLAARARPIALEGWEGRFVLREDVRGEGGDAVMAADLARGLTFLRASNMQVMRLQLATEQHDRRGMMAAIDELVGLDRELGRFIDSIPDCALAGVAREIDAQKRDIMAQRMILARGKIGPSLAPVPEPEVAAELPELVLETPALPAASWHEGDAWAEELETPARRWPWVVLAALIAGAVFFAAINGVSVQSILSWWEQVT